MSVSTLTKWVVCFVAVAGSSAALAVTRTASSCSASAVTSAIASSSNGDTVSVPAGTCTWSSPVSINKSITVSGAGIDKTILMTNGYFVPAGTNDYRITGFTFNGNWGSNYIIEHGQSRTGNKRFRIDHNKFMNKDYSISGTVVFHGYSYGVIDHNIFQDTLDEILAIGGDGAPASSRTPVVGGYENGTIFIEDNQFTLTNACRDHFAPDSHGAAENLFDGNSGPRIVFRYNAVSDHPNCRWLSALETHGFESEFSTVGDARGVYSVKIYGNTFTSNYSQSAGAIKLRGLQGGGVVFNNTFSGTGNSFSDFVELRNLRSHTSDDTGSLSAGNIHAAGYTELCHARQAGESAALTCEKCGGLPGPCFGQVKNLYIWSNVNAGRVLVQSKDYTPVDIVLNSHYFLSSMPGYTPYPYPHPLTSGSGGATLPAPANLRMQ